MRYVAAYLLAVLGGNESPCADDISKILKSVGVGFEKDRADTVVAQLKGKSIEELISEGSKKMASMPSGGGGSSGGASSGGDAPKAEEGKKEEVKKEESEESDDDMGFGLFD